MRIGEWVVLVGAGFIMAFAALVGVLIYLKPPPVRFVYLESSLSKQGEAIFRRESCQSCHQVFGNGARYGPDLDGVGSRRSRAWLHQYLRTPSPGVSDKRYGLRMPAYDKLSPADLNSCLTELLSWRLVSVTAER